MFTSILTEVSVLLPSITDIEPDAGIIGSNAEGRAEALIALIFWVIQVAVIIWFAIAIAGFGRAKSNNPAQMDAARKNMSYAIGALILWGGFGLIVQIATGILA